MNTVPGGYKHSLDKLRTELTFKLKTLSQHDAEWKNFYTQRLQSFEALAVDSKNKEVPSPPSVPLLKD